MLRIYLKNISKRNTSFKLTEKHFARNIRMAFVCRKLFYFLYFF